MFFLYKKNSTEKWLCPSNGLLFPNPVPSLPLDKEKEKAHLFTAYAPT